MAFKSYLAAKRYRGGITKFLYDQVKELSESDVEDGIWVSTEQTGTGAEQSIAHELGVKPNRVVVIPTSIPVAGESATETFKVTEGTHGSANIKVTVTSGAKFKVMALK